MDEVLIGLVVENPKIGEIIKEINLCYEHLWEGLTYVTITEQISLKEQLNG
jgi:hypothetical protein